MPGWNGYVNRQRSRSEEDRSSFSYDVGREYTFPSFKRWADDFKLKWFQGEDKTASDIEEEYWRIVMSGETHLTVEYGSDLAIASHGSGFPLKSRLSPATTSADVLSYAEHPWNLNLLPLVPNSLLSPAVVNTPITGISEPWVYVGMLFR